MWTKFRLGGMCALLNILLAVNPANGQGHSKIKPSDEVLTVRTWESPSDSRDYPEMDDNEGFKYLKKRPFSVAFSGGGTRSATATWGQLRGLDHLGWLDKTRYISAISGGAWVAGSYTFLRLDLCKDGKPCPKETKKDKKLRKKLWKKHTCPPEWSEGAIPSADERFLQPYRKPEELTGCDLGDRYVSPRSLAKDLSSAKLFRLYLSRVSSRGDETYSRVIGKRFLQSAGQYNCLDGECPENTHHPKHQYVAGHAGQVTSMLGRSPQKGVPLNHATFATPRPNRPFLIVGSTLLDAKAFIRGDWRLFPVEMTPFYVGTPQRLTTARGEEIGGGYFESPGMDARHYEFGDCPEDNHEPGCATVIRKQKRWGLSLHQLRFGLSDVLGSSSAAPVLALRGLGLNLLGFPEFRTTAIGNSTTSKKAKEFAFGDGGHIDNLGLIPLLARGQDNLLIFVNSKKPWSKARLGQCPPEPGSRQVSSSGQKPGDLQEVFCPVWVHQKNGKTAKKERRSTDGRRSLLEPTGWENLKAAFDQLATHQDKDSKVISGIPSSPLVYCARFQTVENPRFGIPSYQPRICWVYLERPASWLQALSSRPGDLRLNELKSLTTKKRNLTFGNLPHFGTFFPRWNRLIDLSMPQVQAMGHLTSWTLVESAPAIADCFGLPRLPPTKSSLRIAAFSDCAR